MYEIQTNLTMTTFLKWEGIRFGSAGTTSRYTRMKNALMKALVPVYSSEYPGSQDVNPGSSRDRTDFMFVFGFRTAVWRWLLRRSLP
jgi:outer membrane phospholipase A